MPSDRPIVDECKQCGKEARSRIRSGRMIFVCEDGHRQVKILKFVKGKEKP